MKQTLILGAVALVSMLAGILLFQIWVSDDRVQTAPAVVDSQPELSAIPLTDLNGVESQFANWQGDILIVNFWAPWCAPCRREIPALIELQKNHAERGIKILGIALDGKDPVIQFAGEYQINYPLFLAGNRIAMYNAAFGNPSGSLPFTVILDRNLGIRFQHNGEVTREQLLAELDQIW